MTDRLNCEVSNKEPRAEEQVPARFEHFTMAAAQHAWLCAEQLPCLTHVPLSKNQTSISGFPRDYTSTLLIYCD